ncbi:PREDICTED: collagen alpha-1(XV) chain-like [Poecilia mexicana]|uniref:collagen alpha-1(XV) chain-like n=1 Tax=Poecilia mexicana TaxID=48701 RepID=UPI00072DD736|nr:PREDICTED: collagen alpha-1(XV) chain-like [Poecilia mexicana]
MHLGVKLSAVQGSEQNVILFYSEAGTRQSKEAARFRVPSMTNAWNRFAVAVKDDKAMLYLNCDVEPQVMRMERSAGELELESGSGVFVGQAGGEHPDKFKGAISELRVVGDPSAAARFCEEDDDSDMASGEGSGYEETRRPKPFSEKPQQTV